MIIEPVEHPETGILHWLTDPAGWRESALCGEQPGPYTGKTDEDGLSVDPEWSTDVDWGRTHRQCCARCFVEVAGAISQTTPSTTED
jgi:hypothetical protein